jgi:hypothetical protein
MRGKKGRYYVKEEDTNYEVNKTRGTILISNLFWCEMPIFFWRGGALDLSREERLGGIFFYATKWYFLRGSHNFLQKLTIRLRMSVAQQSTKAISIEHHLVRFGEFGLFPSEKHHSNIFG